VSGRGKPRRARSGHLVYYQPPGREPATAPEAPHRPDALWGWTLAEIHAIARTAALANRWLVSDFIIRYEAAWDAIVDELLAAGARPEAHDLARAGKGAVSRTLLKDFCHTYGVAGRDLYAGVGSAPRFAAYWHEPDRERAEDQITERIAVWQVLAALGGRHAKILTALAAAGDNRAAAAALCIRESSYAAYASQARDAFEEVWFAPETPPRRIRRPHRYAPSEWNMSRLAPCGTPGAFRRHKRNDEEIDDACREANARHDSQRRKARRARTRAQAEGAAA